MLLGKSEYYLLRNQKTRRWISIKNFKKILLMHSHSKKMCGTLKLQK